MCVRTRLRLRLPRQHHRRRLHLHRHRRLPRRRRRLRCRSRAHHPRRLRRRCRSLPVRITARARSAIWPGSASTRWSPTACSAPCCSASMNRSTAAIASAPSAPRERSSAGIHGRKNLTANLSLLAGIAYTQYSEGGYSVTSAPIGAFALRYDFVDWGSSRPFFDIGAILTPYEKVRYRRTYATSLGAVSLDSATTADNYGVYGRAGWMSRLSPRDEVAASVEVWQMWQRVKGYTDPAAALNPFDASITGGTHTHHSVKIHRH